MVYFHVAEDEEGADDTLIYLLAHDSREAGESSFEGFRSAPDWLKARAESESAAGGSLTLPGGVTNVFLNPTDYSKIK